MLRNLVGISQYQLMGYTVEGGGHSSEVTGPRLAYRAYVPALGPTGQPENASKKEGHSVYVLKNGIIL